MRLIDADKINPSDVIDGNNEFADDIRKAIQDLIDIQPTACDNGWIPCSERLPEKDDFYLTTVIFEGKSSTCRHLFDTYNSEWLDSDYMPFVNDEISEIIAWRPLPEPYQSKGE